MNVQKIEKEVWGSYFSELAHKICFEERKPASRDRIDYALLVVDSNDSPCGYITVRELDSETCYWQFGGVFPGTIGTTKSFKAYKACIEWSRGKYKRVSTLIENQNSAMLKFAAKVGFLIVGIRNYHGTVLLEHVMEFDSGI